LNHWYRNSAPVRRIPPVLLGGENGAIPIVRALVQGGIREVIVASERPDDPTFHSRYCCRKVPLARFDERTDQANVQTLIALALSLREKPVLFWGSDREILFINRNRGILARWYRFVFPHPELTENLVDKGRFAAFALAEGLPVPETVVFSNGEEILRQIHSIPFPCTIKPVHMSNWYSNLVKKQFGSYKHALRRLNSPEEMERYIRLVPDIDKGVVVQRFIEGRDDELLSFHGHFNEEGEPVGCFVGRKIRTNPIHFGGSSYIETVHRPDFMEFCIDVCRQIGFTGIVKIDCKRDTQTGQYFILEFNARFNLWEHLGATAGVNLPLLWYDTLSGGCDIQARPSFAYEAGRRWLYVAADVRALPAYVRAGEWTLLSWARSYGTRTVFHSFDWRDPMPFITALPRFLARRFRKWALAWKNTAPVRPVMGSTEILEHPSTIHA
jgi:predicted ATP-grasp superfamily ATP-dependent carboligase